MSDVSKFNGHDIKDKVARQNIVNLELSKASHADVEEAVNAVNETVESVAENVENLEALFNNAGLNNSADGISYDNATSDLEAENVQGAIDKINEKTNGKIIFPTEGRTKIADVTENGYEWVATDDCWLNVNTSATGEGYTLLKIFEGETLVNASSVVKKEACQYADMITLPIKKGQKAVIEYVNCKSIVVVMCK